MGNVDPGISGAQAPRRERRKGTVAKLQQYRAAPLPPCETARQHTGRRRVLVPDHSRAFGMRPVLTEVQASAPRAPVSAHVTAPQLCNRGRVAEPVCTWD